MTEGNATRGYKDKELKRRNCKTETKKVICIRHISKTHDPEPTVSEAKGSNINNPG